MALMLDVPWSREPLSVGYDGATADVEACLPSPYLRRDGDGLHVVNFFGMNNKVPDVSRYRIGPNRHLACDLEVPESRLQIQTQPGSIVLLLESPSEEEYRCGNINWPLAPANGKTGDNIDRCLCRVLSDIQKEFNRPELNEERLIRDRHINEKLIVPDCRVIISNPIQFQTNLRTIHGQSTRGTANSKWKSLRNNVWKALWKEGVGDGRLGYIQLCFRARLNTYRPSLIINACTNDGSLKRCVKDFVRRELPKVPLYHTHHPSTWKKCDSIAPKRIYPNLDTNAGNPH